MDNFKRAILTHGGSASDPNNSDGTHAAALIGMQALKRGHSPLDAVVNAVRHLEDDPRFNAGFGSQLRADGSTIQMDASCMMCNGNFGAVASVEGINNPIDLARGVLLHSQHILFAGEGALYFADDHKIPLIYSDKNRIMLTDDYSCCDTVGAVAYNGEKYAVALSSGGLKNSDIGRVGDVPLPGCGLYCGPYGAIACTGDGEYIALRILAKEIYSWLVQGISPAIAVKKAMQIFDTSVDIGLIILSKNMFAANARHRMAWSQITEQE